ncbi:hypothetical protein BMS3Abin17_00450 [archaeon BMS3Abin17]|nr:hypothetical protein BMS3Abin17_00450 [archaeon BMS3Abin17]
MELHEELGNDCRFSQVSRRDIIGLGDIIEDHNPIHRDSEAARKSTFVKFKDTPIMGTHLALIGERIISERLKKINEHRTYVENKEAQMQILNQSTKFRGSAYPGEYILWAISSYKEIKLNSNKEIELRISGSVDGKKIIDITSRLGIIKPGTKTKVPKLDNPIHKEEYYIDNNLSDLYKFIGGKFRENNECPNMLPVSFVGSSLLSLLRERTKELTGANLSMNFNFEYYTFPGLIDVEIYAPVQKSAKKRGNAYMYKFRAICTQVANSTPVNHGEIVVATPNELGL